MPHSLYVVACWQQYKNRKMTKTQEQQKTINSYQKIKKYLLSLGHTIEEKKLNSGLHGFEMKKNIISGVADKRREGLVLVN